jgi:hypothetical protein
MKTHFIFVLVSSQRILVGGQLHCDRTGFDAGHNPDDHNRGDLCTTNMREN